MNYRFGSLVGVGVMVERSDRNYRPGRKLHVDDVVEKSGIMDVGKNQEKGDTGE